MSEKLTFTSTIEAFENKAWSYYLKIPREIAEPFIADKDRRVLCSVNESKPMHSALMPKKDIYTIYLQKNFMEKNGLTEGSSVEITLEKDASKYGTEVPESFLTLLAQDPAGQLLFHKQSKSNQRLLIQIVNKVKNIDRQLAKGLAIMHHLKEKQGALDFKELNQTIKEFNNTLRPG